MTSLVVNPARGGSRGISRNDLHTIDGEGLIVALDRLKEWF